MSSLATPWLVVVFVAGAGATWLAGISLSKTTDALDFRLGLGEELGGILLLAVAGSLPELAITVSAAEQGNLGLAAGNLIGGIAVQTMVLVVCDIAAGRERPHGGAARPEASPGLVRRSEAARHARPNRGGGARGSVDRHREREAGSGRHSGGGDRASTFRVRG